MVNPLDPHLKTPNVAPPADSEGKKPSATLPSPTSHSLKPSIEAPLPNLRAALGPLAKGTFYKGLLASLQEAPEFAKTMEQVVLAKALYEKGKISKEKWATCQRALSKMDTTPAVQKFDGIKALLDPGSAARELFKEAEKIGGTDRLLVPTALRDPHLLHLGAKSTFFQVEGALSSSPFKLKLKKYGYVQDVMFPFWHRITQNPDKSWTVGVAVPPNRIYEIANTHKPQEAIEELLKAVVAEKPTLKNLAPIVKQQLLDERSLFYRDIQFVFPNFSVRESDFMKLTSSFPEYERVRRVVSQLYIDKKGLEAAERASLPLVAGSKLSNLIADYKTAHLKDQRASSLLAFLSSEANEIRGKVFNSKEKSKSTLRTREWMEEGVLQYFQINPTTRETEEYVVDGKVYDVSQQMTKDLHRGTYFIEGERFSHTEEELAPEEFIRKLVEKGFSEKEITTLSHFANQTSFGSYMLSVFAEHGTLSSSVLNNQNGSYSITRGKGGLTVAADVRFNECSPADFEKGIYPGIGMRLVFLPKEDLRKGSILLETYERVA